MSWNEESCSSSQFDTMREVLFSKCIVKRCQNVAEQSAGPISQKPLFPVFRVNSNNINIINILFSS